MKYYNGIGVAGLDDLFGSYAITVVCIPETMIDGATELLKEYLNKKDCETAELTDMDSIYIIKKFLKNYDGDFIKFFDESHYMFPVGIEASENDTRKLSILTTNPEYVHSEFDALIITHRPNIDFYNDNYKEFCSAMMITDSAMMGKMVNDTLNDFTESEHKIITSLEGEDDSSDKLFTANMIATAISNVSMLSQISNLSLQCKVNIPRKISKKTLDFYLRRCEAMPIDQKKHLLKLHYINILDNE